MQDFMAAMAMYSVMFVLLSLCKFKELHIGLNVFPARWSRRRISKKYCSARFLGKR